jgi:hypothetical protein
MSGRNFANGLTGSGSRQRKDLMVVAADIASGHPNHDRKISRAVRQANAPNRSRIEIGTCASDQLSQVPNSTMVRTLQAARRKT